MGNSSGLYLLLLLVKKCYNGNNLLNFKYLCSSRYITLAIMIIGRTLSADGEFRRIPVRHTQIVDEATRLSLVSYIKERIYEKCTETDWVGHKDVFPNLPDDILDTPLKIVYNLCCKKFAEKPDSIILNLSKYLGMLTREAVYYSEARYFEETVGSVRKYSLEPKGLEEDTHLTK